MNPDTRVCPRCGCEAADHVYCAECGLHLAEQREIPTRAEWEKRPRLEPAPAGEKSDHSPAAGPGRRAIIIGLALIAVLVVGTLIGTVVVGGDDGGDREAASKSGGGEVSAPAEQRCVHLWNGETADGSGPGTYAASSVGLPGLAAPDDVYVSVAFAEDFPDKCLVTITNPVQGTAIQVIESGEESPAGGGHWGMAEPVNPASVPGGAENFNASMDESGALTLH